MFNLNEYEKVGTVTPNNYTIDSLDVCDTISLEVLYEARRLLKKDNSQYFYCYLHPAQYNDLRKDRSFESPYIVRNTMFNRVIGITEDIILIEANEITIFKNKNTIGLSTGFMISNIGEYIEIVTSAEF